MFSRIVYGSRITLTIIALVAVIVGPIGLLIGTLAGYFGGWFDTVLMRITDIFLSFPSLILSLAFVAALGTGHRERHRRDRADLLAAYRPARAGRDADAAQRGLHRGGEAAGRERWRIILAQIVPMCMPSVHGAADALHGAVILTAAGLGFLGLGAQPPTAGMGRDDLLGRQLHARRAGGSRHARAARSSRQPRLQPLR